LNDPRLSDDSFLVLIPDEFEISPFTEFAGNPEANKK